MRVCIHPKVDIHVAELMHLRVWHGMAAFTHTTHTTIAIAYTGLRRS